MSRLRKSWHYRRLKRLSQIEEVNLYELAQNRIKNLEAQVRSLRLENAEYKRQALDYHQKYIQAEEVIDQLKNEFLAVLRSKADFKASVIQYMLTIREAQLRIEHAIKQLKGPRIAFGKWMAITIIAIATIAAFAFTPGLSHKFMSWLSSPLNQFFLIALAIIVGLIIYYVKGRRK